MRAGVIVVTVLFTILELLATLGMAAVSVHGPSGLIPAAIVYAVVSIGLTWWIASRYARLLPVLGVGLALLVAGPSLFLLLDWIDRMKYERRIAATRVSDVRDELISSANGHPIGVRVMYKVTVPSRGYFAISPSLYGGDPRNERLRLGLTRLTVDGSAQRPFEPGHENVVVAELYPPILFFKRDTACLAMSMMPVIPETSSATPLRVQITESTYGNTYHGGREEQTHGSYNLAELYRGVLAEKLAPCS